MFASMIAQRHIRPPDDSSRAYRLGTRHSTYGGQPLQGSRPSELKELFRGDPNDLNGGIERPNH